MQDWLQQHWPHGVVVLLFGLLRWVGLREVKRHDEGHADHESRLRVIEKEGVTRDQLDEVRASLTASINTAADVIRGDVRELRGHLMERKP